MQAVKLGFNLYRHMLTEENFRFARQCGATHLVIHLVDYFNREQKPGSKDNQPVGRNEGWGHAGIGTDIWPVDELLNIKKRVNAAGLELEAVENIDPYWWYDILLDGPEKAGQIERLKELVRRLGKAGIPCLGYNFSIAGVAGRIEGPFARGGALSVGMDGVDQTPLPGGMIWNMVYDTDHPGEQLEFISHEVLWERLSFFLRELVPVAEQAGVRLAAHPDDPPVESLRNTPRLVHKPDLYQKLLDIIPSPSNSLEFCLGTIAEMQGGDVYEATDRYSRSGSIAYIHFRNVVGKAPYYKEVFIDEGEVDMHRIIDILHKNKYRGVLVPDHTPLMSCDAPWHAGMAYMLGYMKAIIDRY
jgi:mannonate dehydratase